MQEFSYLWLRAFFPRWNFFDRVSHEVFLEYKPYGTDDWVNVVFDSKRELFSLLFNPRMTMQYAEKNILENFVNSANETGFADPKLVPMISALAKCYADEAGFQTHQSLLYRVGVELVGHRQIIAEAST